MKFTIKNDKSTLTVELKKVRSYGKSGGTELYFTVRINIPGYSAEFDGDSLMLEELEAFLDDIEKQQSEFSGESKLLTPFLDIIGKMDELSHVTWECSTTYPYAEGATLEFEIGSDQSFLSALITELRQFIEHARSLEL